MTGADSDVGVLGALRIGCGARMDQGIRDRFASSERETQAQVRELMRELTKFLSKHYPPVQPKVRYW